MIDLGDARDWLSHLDVDASRAVIVTDPVWPNAPDGMFPGIDAGALFASAAAHFPRLARRAVVHLGCMSDPRILAGMPPSLPFVRVVWLRYACPSYCGTLLNSGDVAYVFGSREGAHGKTLLAGECTSTSTAPRTTSHPCPRKLQHVEWLIANCTRPDDVVIDPFSGSGTTALACLKLQRQFRGCEINEAFRAEALARLEREGDEGPLFRSGAA